MDLYIPCAVNAVNSVRKKFARAHSGLVLQSKASGTRHLVTTASLKFDGVTQYELTSIAEGDGHDNPEQHLRLIDIRNTYCKSNLLILKIPPSIEVATGFDGYVHRLEIDLYMPCHLPLRCLGKVDDAGHIEGIGTAVNIRCSQTGVETVETGLIKIRRKTKNLPHLAGTVWHVENRVLGIAISQNDDFVFVLPIYNLLSLLDDEFDIYNRPIMKPPTNPTLTSEFDKFFLGQTG